MPHENQHPGAPAGDDVERLLRVGGPREVPDPIRRAAARVTVRDAWRGSLRARSRRRRILIGTPLLAAAATLAFVIVAPRRQTTPPLSPAVVARLAPQSSAPQLQRGSERRRLAMNEAVHAGDIVETSAGSVAAVSLEGGGELRQNGGTLVRWTALRRIALDRGQIYVDSGDRAAAPIVIETSAGVIRDIGTKFDVQVRGAEVRVRVREGAVRFESMSGNRDATAGREIVATAGRSLAAGPAETVGSEWEWILRATAFQLEGATMSRFASWVEREGGYELVFRPADLRRDAAATVLHGSVRGLSMREALDVVFPAVGLLHRVDGSRVILERPATGERE